LSFHGFFVGFGNVKLIIGECGECCVEKNRKSHPKSGRPEAFVETSVAAVEWQPKRIQSARAFSDSSASQNGMFESNGQPIIYNAILRKKNTILRQSRQGLTAVSFSESERTHFFARAKIAGEVLCIFKPDQAGNLRDRPAGLQQQPGDFIRPRAADFL
jgi:hypothetical protein